MDKELTVPKWVQPKIPQMPAQAQKFEIFEKALWESDVRGIIRNHADSGLIIDA